MIESMKTALTTWNTTTPERRKLQHVYLALAAIVVLLAGLVSLINPTLGHNSLIIAGIAFGAFLTNAIVWNLLSALVLVKLPGKPKRK